VRNGTRVALINPRAQELLFPVAAQFTSNGLGMAQHVAALLVAALRVSGGPVPRDLEAALDGIVPTADHERVASLLAGQGLRVILLGGVAERHPAFSEIRALTRALAAATGASLGFVPDGGNAAGASLAGATPHRGAGGRPVARPGLAALEMLNAGLRGYVLIGGLESADIAPSPSAGSALASAECVVALTPYAGPEQLANSTIILPVAAFAETSGTWVNVEGRWQSVPGAARPPGEARPAWKVLRVLGNLLGLPGFDYVSSEDVRDELRRELQAAAGPDPATGFAVGRLSAVDSTRELGIYEVDAIVRRSRPLQQTRDGRAGARGGAR
jgi:NADH-quinone oxidoreductase subunit G